MGLNEREKIIYITAVIRKMIEQEIRAGENQDHVIAVGKDTMYSLFKELGLRPKKGMFAEIVKFEDELDVIADILEKECKYKPFNSGN